MDGDTSDWNWIPEKYFITTELMTNRLNGNNNDNYSCKCKIIVGWNDVKNRIYILAIILQKKASIDHISIEGKSLLNANIEVAINPDNLGGMYGKNMERTYNTIKFNYSVPLNDTTFKFELNNGPQWYANKFKYLDYGGKKKVVLDGQFELTVYEISTILWDFWNPEDIEYCRKSELFMNKNIRLSISVNNIDEAKGSTLIQWVTFSGKNWTNNADEMSEFVLDAPFKKGISWDIINTLLNPK